MELWKIKMKTTSAGPEKSMLAGKEYDVPQQEAEQLIPLYADLVWKPEEKADNQDNVNNKNDNNQTDEFPQKIENGKYLLSNGAEFLGGKAKVIAAEQALKEGVANVQTDNSTDNGAAGSTIELNSLCISDHISYPAFRNNPIFGSPTIN
jgi:hypothetical protein